MKKLRLYRKLKLLKDNQEETRFEEVMKSVPKESEEDIRYQLDDEILGIDEAIVEAQDYLFQEEDEIAMSILEEKMSEFENLDLVPEDAHFFYYSIKHPQEEYLFELLERSDKELIPTKENYGLMYQTYGAVLLGQERIEESQEYFKKSLQWNPFDVETRLFVIEILKMNNLLDLFFFENKKLLKMAIASKAIAIIYQNFAYYYLQKKEYKSALYSFLMSTNYGMEPDPYMLDLLEQIDQKNQGVDIPSEQEIYSYFIAEGIPVPPDDDLYEFFLEQALEQESKDISKAMTCLNILSEIKNSLEQESDDEKRIHKKYARKVSAEIHKFQELPVEMPKDSLIEMLSLAKVYVPFIKELTDLDEFPCGVVENREKDMFLPIYLFPSKISQSQKNSYDIHEVPFTFCIGLLDQWDELDGIVIHPFSKDSFEIRREDFGWDI